MDTLLKQLGLEIPNIEEHDDGFLQIKRSDDLSVPEWMLFFEGKRWMQLRYLKQEAFEFYTHVSLAHGKCICTGLGLGIREKSLLAKPEVTEVLVIEKNEAIINYHKKVNPDLMDKITVVHGDANTYVGECDTLLIDHFEEETSLNHPYIFCTVKEISKNIKHDTLWFWPLESYIVNLSISKNPLEAYLRYENYRKEYPTLPDLTLKELLTFYSIFDLFRPH